MLYFSVSSWEVGKQGCKEDRMQIISWKPLPTGMCSMVLTHRAY